jgi:hypothetical protein
VHNTGFAEDINKDPKRQIFVDVASGGVNHGISVFYVTVCSFYGCFYFTELL